MECKPNELAFYQAAYAPTASLGNPLSGEYDILPHLT